MQQSNGTNPKLVTGKGIHSVALCVTTKSSIIKYSTQHFLNFLMLKTSYSTASGCSFIKHKTSIAWELTPHLQFVLQLRMQKITPTVLYIARTWCLIKHCKFIGLVLNKAHEHSAYLFYIWSYNIKKWKKSSAKCHLPCSSELFLKVSQFPKVLDTFTKAECKFSWYWWKVEGGEGGEFKTLTFYFEACIIFLYSD
jgi:hypothetical protein